MTESFSYPPTNVIRSLLQNKYYMSVYTQDMPYALNAEITELDPSSRLMVLDIEYGGEDLGSYLNSGGLNFDLETLHTNHNVTRETYSLRNLPAKYMKTDSGRYRLECRLPRTVFINESRGSVRIPFIMGMYARVRLEIYPHVLIVPGTLSNLSVSGCMIEIDMAESIALTESQKIPGITLAFPQGARFHAEGEIRHIRPFGNHGYAAVGIEFINLTATQTEDLFHYVKEAEREAAYRSGQRSIHVTQSPLFIPGERAHSMLQSEKQDRDKLVRNTPMEHTVLQVSHMLQVGLMQLKSRNHFSGEIFYDCVDTLLHLLSQDKKSLLSALPFLRDEPDWVRQAVQVTCRLADILLRRDPHDPLVREAMFGSLLHTMGKPLLVSEQLPSLKSNMNSAQKLILKGHIKILLITIEKSGFKLSPVCRDVIENAGERLDGTGYPAGKKGEQLSPLARLVAVIKVINTLTHGRNGIPPYEPLDAYRLVYENESTFDRSVLVEYIQKYGLYPIGSLAKYSSGFLGWIQDINGKGIPDVVHIVKNLRFPDTNISSTVTKDDCLQLGRLEGIVNPADFGINVHKH